MNEEENKRPMGVRGDELCGWVTEIDNNGEAHKKWICVCGTTVCQNRITGGNSITNYK